MCSPSIKSCSFMASLMVVAEKNSVIYFPKSDKCSDFLWSLETDVASAFHLLHKKVNHVKCVSAVLPAFCPTCDGWSL